MLMILIYWGWNVHSIKQTKVSLLVGSKKVGLEVNGDETKELVMSWDRNIGRSHSINIDNSSFKRVEEFKYLETTVTNQNYIQGKIKIDSVPWSKKVGVANTISINTRVGTLIVAAIYLQLIQNRYMFRSFTVLQCSHQHCVQPVASDVEVVGYL